MIRKILAFQTVKAYISILYILIVFFCITNAQPIQAAEGINEQIHFQGKVVNDDGTNVTDGSYTFVFRIYSVDTGGSPIWTETRSGGNQVSVTDGIFSVNLGSVTAFPGSVDFNSDTLYLGVEFNGDGEMDPRIRFTAVPYAFNAKTVSGLTVTDTTGTLTIPDATTLELSGANNLTLTTSGVSNVTLPTTGTLSTLAGSEEFTNKTIGSTGLVFSGATVDITTGTDQDLVLTPNGTGFVGIGTNDPEALLHVAGAIKGAGALSGITTVATSGDWTTTATTPSITINSAESFTISDGTDSFVINTASSLVSFLDGASNGFTLDADTGASYAGTARPSRKAQLVPEFPGAVISGDGSNNTGRMASDFCEQGAHANIPDTNTAVCNTSGDIHNYYTWTTNQGSVQDYDIWVRWRVPDNFSAWDTNPVQVYGKRTDATNNEVRVYVYDTAGALNNSGGTQIAGTSWTQTAVSLSGGTWTAGSYMTLRIVLAADTGGDTVHVGEINLNYLSSN